MGEVEGHSIHRRSQKNIYIDSLGVLERLGIPNPKSHNELTGYTEVHKKNIYTSSIMKLYFFFASKIILKFQKTKINS